MRFYTQQHNFYCGVDLHARSMYVCILDQAGEVRLHRKLACRPEDFLRAIKPYRDGLVVAVECLFCWYWLADLCAEQRIPFVLGHALYMKAIHGGKSKNPEKVPPEKSPPPQRGAFAKNQAVVQIFCAEPKSCSVVAYSSSGDPGRQIFGHASWRSVQGRPRRSGPFSIA